MKGTLIILAMLAWSALLPMRLSCYGQEASSASDLTDGQKFVPSDSLSSPAGTLELRQEATVFGGDVKLKQICRWSEADAPVFTPIADLVVLHVPDKTPFQPISVDNIRQTLHEAGINIAMINFAGATSCTISRSDVPVSQQDAMQQWIDAQQKGGLAKIAEPAAQNPAASPDLLPIAGAPAVASAGPAPSSGAVPAAEVQGAADPNFHSLRQLLTSDICTRLDIAPAAIQMTWSPEDEKVLSLVEPCFKFDIKPSRARTLGNVSWDVNIFTDSASKKVHIAASAREWLDQVIVAKPLAMKEILTAEDFATKHILVDSLPDQTLLRLDQCVDQQAAEDLKPGVIMTAQMVDPVPLVKPGQLVTVTLTQGSIQVRSVARALEEGTLGQAIKVRYENTRDVLDVTVTGPQEARLGSNFVSADTVSPAN